MLERIVDGLGIPRSTIGLVDAEPTDKALPVPTITVGPQPATQRPRTPRFRRKVMVGPQGPDVPLWTAAEIWSLRQAMRMTANDFASHLGVSARALCKWEAGTTPGPFEQSLLDTTLKQATPVVQSRFILLMTPERPSAKQGREDDS